MDRIVIPLNDDCLLDAGTISTHLDEELDRKVFVITPPTVPMFDQVVAYLWSMPEPGYMGYQGRYLGVGLAALCIRWGSYLATLMDPTAPFHERIPQDAKTMQNQDASWLTNREMMRLNIEISYGLGQMCRLFAEDRYRYLELIMRAYHYLPMPQKTARPNKELNEGLWQAQLQGSVMVHINRHPEAIADIVQALQLPNRHGLDTCPFHDIQLGTEDRVIGNFLANFGWRNTVIETYHGGQINIPRLKPHERRFSQRDERLLLRELANNMVVVDRALWRLHNPDSQPFPPPLGMYIKFYPDAALALRNSHAMWFYSYPHDWSENKTSSPIRL
jgi:hypothetical protein